MEAIITGASSGIGATLAPRLARAGWDLVLVARRADRLEALAKQIEKDVPGRKARAIGLDVTAPDAAKRLLEQCPDADVLINNAGYGKHGAALDISLEHSTSMVRLNCEALTALTMAYLPRMVARGRGTILNVSSIAGFQPIPYFAVYSATKAYVTSLSMALDAEVRSKGVRVLCLCPGPVPTEFQEVADTTMDHSPKIFVRSPELIADRAVWMIQNGVGLHVPGWPLRMQIFFQRLLPRSLVVYLAGKSVPPNPVKKEPETAGAGK
jgi:short-subunit dehydrogenase